MKEPASTALRRGRDPARAALPPTRYRPTRSANDKPHHHRQRNKARRKLYDNPSALGIEVGPVGRSEGFGALSVRVDEVAKDEGKQSEHQTMTV